MISKLVVGLGNIGEKYKNTRHNLGFELCDKIAENLNTKFSHFDSTALFSKNKYKDLDLILMKPLLFMNNSGVVLKKFLDFYKINISDLLVIFDDISLPAGKLRFRPSGSDGGHNGVKSIIHQIYSEKFSRLKLGIGPAPTNIPLDSFVLGKFTNNEKPIIAECLNKSAEAVFFWLENKTELSMQKYN